MLGPVFVCIYTSPFHRGFMCQHIAALKQYLKDNKLIIFFEIYCEECKAWAYMDEKED